MNKEFALQVLTEVQGTSPSYIKEYGVSTVRSAYRYIERLNKRNPDEKMMYLLDNVMDKLLRIN